MSQYIDMRKIIEELSQERPIFLSEEDMQLELAWKIKTIYPNAQIRLEYSPNLNKYKLDTYTRIDILVIINNGWIPIELKYKKKEFEKTIKDEYFYLRNDGAQDQGRYNYLKDIERIENICKCVPEFLEGYTLLITNDLSYTKAPTKKDGFARNFYLVGDKHGKIDWAKNKEGKEASSGTKNGCEKPIHLKDNYTMNWEKYSDIDESNAGKFIYLLNEIKKLD